MCQRQNLTHRSGIVLVVVLLIIGLIAAIVFEFSHDSYFQFQLAGNLHRSHQALHCAEAGLALATALLERPDDCWADDEAVEVLTGGREVEIGEGSFRVSVVGEQGKINVNGLISANGKMVRGRIDQMLRLIDVLNSQYSGENPISYGVIPAIVDWIDTDEDVTVLPFVGGDNAGAESRYYQHLDEPYRSKNGPIDVLGELLFIKGMTLTAFRGSSGRPGEAPTYGMKQFLTVYGDGRLNINYASPSILQTLCEDLDSVLAEAIVRNRPYKNLRELSEVPGMTPEILKAIGDVATVSGRDTYYTITAKGIVDHCVRTIRLMVERDPSTKSFRPVVRWEI